MAEASNENKKGRRCTIDLTPAASVEVDRICTMFDLKIVDMFRYSLLLMRIYAEAVEQGRQMRLVNPDNPSEIQVIELPLFTHGTTRRNRGESGVEKNAAGTR
jgi:hypothetical protein